MVANESELAETCAVIEWLFRTQAVPAFKQHGSHADLVERWGVEANIARMAAVGRYVARLETQAAGSV